MSRSSCGKWAGEWEQIGTKPNVTQRVAVLVVCMQGTLQTWPKRPPNHQNHRRHRFSNCTSARSGMSLCNQQSSQLLQKARAEGAGQKAAREASPSWGPRRPQSAEAPALTPSKQQSGTKIPGEQLCWGLLED